MVEMDDKIEFDTGSAFDRSEFLPGKLASIYFEDVIPRKLNFQRRGRVKHAE